MSSELAHDLVTATHDIIAWTRDALAGVTPLDGAEEGFVRQMIHYLQSDAQHFSREQMPSHFTASIMLTQGENTLLLHHRKLNLWLQPGGHIDSGEFPYEAAIREMKEELGIGGSDLVESPRLIMADIHRFPARDNVAAHDHLDLRFHGVLRKGVTPRFNINEALNCRWFSFEQILQDSGSNRGVRRTIQKIVLQRDYTR